LPYSRYAPEKIPYGVKRYTDETKRLYSVLEDNFNTTGSEWIVGNKYSIVDMSSKSFLALRSPRAVSRFSIPLVPLIAS